MLKHLTICIFKIQEPYITKIRLREWQGSNLSPRDISPNRLVYIVKMKTENGI